ncbi:MAG TPA: hypothetical protein VII27_04330 [Thermoplasmata archaeon]
MCAAAPGTREDPYRKILRLQEEAADWEVKAHKSLLVARKLETKAARLSLKASQIGEKAEAQVARSRSIESQAVGMLHEDQAADKDLKVEKARQLGHEAESLRHMARAVESQAEQLRIAARAKIVESEKSLENAKARVREAEATKGLL